MVTVTVSEMVTHLDNLVLDYIQRRQKMSVPEPSPFHAKNTTESKRQDTLDITLEEIYLFHFVGSKCFSQHTMQTISSYCTREVESSLQQPLPKLPLEIVERILEFGSVEHLLSLRCLSRSMNSRMCKRLQHFKGTVTLQKQSEVERFLSTFAHRIEHSRLPIQGVNLGGNWRAISSVLQVAGSQVAIKLDALDVTDLSRDGQAEMQHVQSIGVRGLPNTAEKELLRGVELPALRHLSLHLKLDDEDSEDELNFEDIKSWLQLAPSLRMFVSWIPARLSPSEAFGLFSSHSSLSKIHLNKIVHTWKNGEMDVALSLTNVDLWHAIDLGSYADFVVSLIVPYEFPNRLPPFPRLTHLTVTDHQPGPPRPIQLNATPLLQHVTLHAAISSNFSAQHQHMVFESVGSLTLFDGKWTWTKSHPPLFHLIFPKVATLELSGHLPTKFINYFATHFIGVSNLKFKRFNKDNARNLRLFQVRVPQRKDIVWPFFKLENLKKLEFHCDKGLRETVLSLVWLTLNKYIQPLQKLSIVQMSLAGGEDDGTLFYSMRHLMYHKELKFRCM